MYHSLKEFEINILKYWYIYVSIIALLLIFLMIFTRNYKWNTNILVSNIRILLQMLAYIVTIAGLGTLFMNYRSVKQHILDNRMMRSRSANKYFSDNIKPLMKKFENDTRKYYKRYMKSKHQSLVNFNEGVYNEALLNAFNSNFENKNIQKICSWINTLDDELNRKYIDNNYVENKIGLSIISFFYGGSIEFENDFVFISNSGCRDIYFNKWRSLTNKFYQSNNS